MQLEGSVLQHLSSAPPSQPLVMLQGGGNTHTHTTNSHLPPVLMQTGSLATHMHAIPPIATGLDVEGAICGVRDAKCACTRPIPNTHHTRSLTIASPFETSRSSTTFCLWCVSCMRAGVLLPRHQVMTLVCHLLQVGNGALIFGYIFLAFHEGHPTCLFAIYVTPLTHCPLACDVHGRGDGEG